MRNSMLGESNRAMKMGTFRELDKIDAYEICLLVVKEVGSDCQEFYHLFKYDSFVNDLLVERPRKPLGMIFCMIMKRCR